MRLCFSAVAAEELQTKINGGGGRSGASTDRIVIPCLKSIVEFASVELEGMNDGPNNNLQAKTLR